MLCNSWTFTADSLRLPETKIVETTSSVPWTAAPSLCRTPVVVRLVASNRVTNAFVSQSQSEEDSLHSNAK